MNADRVREFQAKVAADPQARARFAADPKAALAGAGILYPAETRVHAVFNDARHVTLIVRENGRYLPEELAKLTRESRTVLQRAGTDAGFRALLLASPVDALFLELGYRMPDTMALQVRLENEQNAYFAVWLESDSAAAFDEEELSELELDGVTGGASGPADFARRLTLFS